MKRETIEGKQIKELRTLTGLSQQKFGAKFGIPAMNIANWEQGMTKPPEYVVLMITKLLEYEKELAELKGETASE